MSSLPPELALEIEAVRSDRLGGASAVMAAAAAVLRRAGPLGAVLPAARALCQAQPSMAPVWNVAMHAVAFGPGEGPFEAFVGRAARAPRAVVTFAVEALTVGMDRSPLRLTTLSASSAVAQVVRALAERAPISLTCAEGRPALEGRRLAQDLAASGVPVTVCTDAALALGLEPCDAVLVGADAVGPTHFVNKVGTLMLAAAASARGVPAHVLASRDKFVMPELWPRIDVRDRPSDEVWPSPPDGVRVRNPYFEAIPVDLVSSVISDAGVLGADLVRGACESLSDRRLVAALKAIEGL